MYDPTLPPRLSLAATRSSKKVSLLEGESGLTPARNTPSTRYNPARACPAACLTEAARATAYVQVSLSPSNVSQHKTAFIRTIVRLASSFCNSVMTTCFVCAFCFFLQNVRKARILLTSASIPDTVFMFHVLSWCTTMIGAEQISRRFIREESSPTQTVFMRAIARVAACVFIRIHFRPHLPSFFLGYPCSKSA